MKTKWSFNRQKILEAIVRGCDNGAKTCILRIQRNIRENLSKAGSGVHYSGNPARSSAPGEPPATQSGRLRNSWQAQPRRASTGTVVRFILSSAGVPYAAILEFGGSAGRKRGVRIKQRPYIRPAVIAVQKDAGQIFASAIAKELKSTIVRK